jgi:hypothetical protein
MTPSRPYVEALTRCLFLVKILLTLKHLFQETFEIARFVLTPHTHLAKHKNTSSSEELDYPTTDDDLKGN